MVKNETTQLELFQSEYDTSSHVQINQKTNDPIHALKVYASQKITGYIIVLLFIGIISYSLGVERGKKLIISRADSTLVETNVKTTPKNTFSLPLQGSEQTINTKAKDLKIEPVKKLDEQPKLKNNEQFKKTNFTIQVASIKQAQNAAKELSVLKNKGYSAFSLTKGKYTVICIGNFRAKEEAQNYMKEIKSRYPDCQIRRL